MIRAETIAPPTAITEPFHYQSRHDFLSYSAGILSYSDKHTEIEIRLNEFFLPATPPYPWITSLADHPHYIESLLAFLELCIDAGHTIRSPAHTVVKLCTFFREVIDWLRMHSIFNLRDATSHDIHALAKEVAQQGWRGALKYEERWVEAVSSMSKDELRDGFYFAKKTEINGLKTVFWSRVLGWNSKHNIPASAMTVIESHFEKSPKWQDRRDQPSSGSPTKVVSTVLTNLNRLAFLQGPVDKFSAPAFSDLMATARKLASKSSVSTENLALEDAVAILKGTVTVIYDIAPLLFDVLREIQLTKDKLRLEDFANHIFSLSATSKIEALIDWQIGEFTFLGKDTRLTKEANGITCIDRVIGLVQSACATAIAGLTAHRSGEISHRNTGLRVGDLYFDSPDDEVALLNIYFLKTYKRRIPIQVCRLVIDAFLCLEKLKQLCLPSSKDSLKIGEDLFAAHKPVRRVDGKDSSMSFYFFGITRSNIRSLGFFLEFCFKGRTKIPKFTPKMLRRFFSTLFMNRYRHPDIRVLQHILGHLSVSTSLTYGYDKPNVAPDKRIESRLGVRNSERGYDALEFKALRDHVLLVRKDIEVVAKERLYENVKGILLNGTAAGGFSKLINKLHAHLLLNTQFLELNIEEQAEEIAALAYAKGYRTEPMYHGECHAKLNPDQNHRAQCQKDGQLHKENAGPITCSNCFSISWMRNILRISTIYWRH